MDGWMGVEGREASVQAVSPGLHWDEITSLVGGCKMQHSAGRHQAGLTGVFSNLTIVSEGLFFGLLSHYAVMVAIFCLGIWLFLGGNKCQNVFKSSIYHVQFVKPVKLYFHKEWHFRQLWVLCWIYWGNNCLHWYPDTLHFSIFF